MYNILESSNYLSRSMLTKIALLALLVFSLPGHASDYSHDSKYTKNWFGQTYKFKVKVVKRAITGGTGPYSTTKGEHRQSSLGLGLCLITLGSIRPGQLPTFCCAIRTILGGCPRIGAVARESRLESDFSII